MLDAMTSSQYMAISWIVRETVVEALDLDDHAERLAELSTSAMVEGGRAMMPAFIPFAELRRE